MANITKLIYFEGRGIKRGIYNIFIISILFVLFQFNLFLYSATAAPHINSVSGKFIKDEIVEITGNSFSTKNPVTPVLWDDLESGAPSTSWSLLEKGLEVTNATGQLPNSKYAFRLDKGAGDASVDMRKNYILTDKFYIFVKRRYDFAVTDDNHKFLRIWQTSGSNSIAWTYNWGTSYHMKNSATPLIDPDNPIPNYVITLGWDNFPPVGKWQTEEFFVKLETAIGAFNGVMGYRLDNKKHRSWAENRKMFSTTSNYPLGQIFIDNFSNRISLGRAKPGDYIWVDSIYMDNTWARVVIGDNAIYDNCSKKLEIQYPLTWNQDKVTIRFNQGTFQSGESAYLFVFDANNQVSNGHGPITIGSGGVSVPTPTDNPPTVSITSPTSASSYTSSENAINISGTAADDKLITGITWANSSGGSGNVIDSAGDWSKFFADISLKEGANDITVKATDSNNKTSTDTLAITYNSDNIAQSWSAIKQTGDSNWKASGVTYCVRLLIEGAHITQPGGNIILGFKGRSSGNYSIRKVSIAERDVNSSVGNVVNSTWTRVTFDGKAYNSWELDEAVVLAGTEKRSDPIPFSIQPGKDYYVTFKIVSPSVYLRPPSSYRELYFVNADHASDIDWSGNGHSLTQYYHALSSIYVISNPDLLPPRDVTNVGHSRNGNQLTFTWTNPKSTENGTVIPENKDFAGVMIRYNTGKGVLPPASHSEGTLFCDKPGNLDANDSCTNSIELNQNYAFSLFTYDSSGNYSNTVYVTVDANPPGVINNFAASSGDKQITLSWTNPSDQDYAGTVVRYGTGAYPSNEKDGSLVVDKKGTPSGNSSFIHSGLQNALKYYYSAFAYDPSGNYSQAVNLSAAPRLPPDAIPPAPPAGTVVK